MTPHIYVYASTQIDKVIAAIEKHSTKIAHTVVVHIQSSSNDWMVSLQEKLTQGSLFDDTFSIILYIEEKDIKSLKTPWFQKFITQPSPHTLIIGLSNSYAKKHSVFNHAHIRIQDLYDRAVTLTPEERRFVGDDKDALHAMTLLKARPQQFQAWYTQHHAVSIPERIASLHAVSQTAITHIFLLWVQTLRGIKPLAYLDTLNTQERMECYNMVAAWVRGGLMDEENAITTASGLMKWPDAATAWRMWCTRTTYQQRTAWYMHWLEQEVLLKGLDYPRQAHVGWMNCKKLHQQWGSLVS